LLNQISVAGIECTLWSKQLLVFSSQIIGCETTLPTSAIICASCLFQIGDGGVLGEIKEPPNLMPALRRQIVAEAQAA
jgi:hypothetical protein